MSQKAFTGFLVVGDISGYTSHVATTELAHSQEVLAELLEPIVSRNRVLNIPTVYVGSLNTSVIRVGELYREALHHNAAAFIVVHNHPSGICRHPHRMLV